jgi:malonate transporter and related proteins
MSAAVFGKLLAIIVTVALGWVAGRMRWLGDAQADPARILSNAAFYIFVPALLFRTTARVDLGALPAGLLLAYFVPTIALLLVVYGVQQLRQRRHEQAEPALPAVRAISVSYGNAVQMGIPMSAAMFGEAGLGIHLMLVSVHGLILLSLLTALVELDLARSKARQEQRSSLWQMLRSTLRNTVIHPVVLPVLLGLTWNLLGLGLPGLVDEVLKLLGSAVVPLCLVLIGLSLAYYGLQGSVRGALGVSVLKLLGLPALVLVVAHWGFGLSGLPLSVLVMMAALPVGSNALIFAQRYETMQAEATAAIVFSTLAFVLSAPLWLALLARLPG